MSEKKIVLNDLRTFPMLANLKDEDLSTLAGLLEKREYKVGERIIEEGTSGDTMHFLIEGTVDVVKTTLYGEEYVCATLKDDYHCVFGEMAMIDRDKRSASIVATSPCRTLVMKGDDFKSYCKQYPAVGCELLFFLATNLCRNLRNENENLLKVYQALIEEVEA